MGVPGQDNVNSINPACQFAINIKTVMACQHHKVGAGTTSGVNIFLNHFFVDAKRPVGNHITWVGYRGIGESLSDNGNFYAATFKECGRFKNTFLPFVIFDVTGKERKVKFFNQFLHAFLSIGKFPMRNHNLNAQCVHGVNHVFAQRLQ